MAQAAAHTKFNGAIRDTIGQAVCEALNNWPNAHLGDYTVQQDLKSAFRFIRSRLKAGWSIQAAAGALMSDALAHGDM